MTDYTHIRQAFAKDLAKDHYIAWHRKGEKAAYQVSRKWVMYRDVQGGLRTRRRRTKPLMEV